MSTVIKTFGSKIRAIIREIAMTANGLMDDPDFPKCSTCGRIKAVKMSMGEPDQCEQTDSVACKGAAIVLGRAPKTVKIRKI